MSFEPSQLLIATLSYLLALLGIAQAAEKQWISPRIIHHPLTHVLSLGVFAHAWAIYGVVALAHEFGYGFLAYYIGIATCFLLASLLLIPLWRLSRRYMLSSLADLLALRYHSQWAGAITTLSLLCTALPLLTLQIQTIAETASILTSNQFQAISSSTSDQRIAFVYCLLIGGLTMLFGAKHLTAHEHNNGLVTAVAFESLLKVLVLLGVGLVSVQAIFGGFGGLNQWLTDNPRIIDQLHTPLWQDSPRTLLIIFFGAAVVMPHLFHMIIVETPSSRMLRTASWGAPLLLLLLSLPVLPILWGGYSNGTELPPEYFTLSIGLQLQQPLLTLLVFLCGVSAASSVIIVMTLALASMSLKHLILPFYRPSSVQDMHRRLLWLQRLLILAIILAGYLFYLVMVNREALASLGLAAFIAALQLFPGAFATLYWQRANSRGFIAGLLTGLSIWFVALLRPIISDSDPLLIDRPPLSHGYEELWHIVTLLSLALNTAVFVAVSLLSHNRHEEREAATACSIDDISRPRRRLLSATSAMDMQERLATALGQRSAEREMQRALAELHMQADENRPYALRLLRNGLEANLSHLMGPTVARQMIEQLLPYEPLNGQRHSEDINLIERQLEHDKNSLTGLAADLDSLRRRHRSMLQELPVGVCSLGADQEVLMWNDAIATLTGIDSDSTVGSQLHSLPDPWRQLLDDFLQAPQQHRLKQPVEHGAETRWINLHKASGSACDDGQVIVMEDASELQRLEHKLSHSERLAAIGQLAAGVAHEIGNPITGIACLAQNLRYDTDNPDSLVTAEEILKQTKRVSRIVHTLVNFAHAGQDQRQQPQLVAVNLRQCASEAIELLSLNKEAKAVPIDNHCDPQHQVLADQQRLLQVLVNLISNARDASPSDGRIQLDSQRLEQHVELRVTDQGPGISPQLQQKIFDPFFTTKEAGEGTGLGLYLVYNILEEMGGDIQLHSPVNGDNGGSRFTIRLQPATAAAEPAPASD